MNRNVASWRLLYLAPAALLFCFGAYEVFQHREVLELAKRAARPLPPTMFTEHSGLAVAAFAAALALAVLALRGR